MPNPTYPEFSDLQGRILSKIERDERDTEMTFTAINGERWRLYHEQDCCENVGIEEIAGDLDNLLLQPIVLEEESSQDDENASESGTWTFYRLSTVKGDVTIRWYGTSNGYYSEYVTFSKDV